MEIPSLDDYQKLLDEVRDLKTMVSLMADSMRMPKTVKVADICKIEGVSRTQICGKQAYLLPYNGKSQYPDGTARWDVDVYLKWRSIPIERRKESYRTYLDDIRKKGLAR